MEFRSIVQREFDRRRSANRRYTLRAFARSAGIDHGSLSQILRGRRRAGLIAITSIGRHLHLDPEQMAACRNAEVEEAVLRAVRRRDFRPASRWLAVRLGLPVDEVNVVIQRLLRLGRLRMLSAEAWSVAQAVSVEEVSVGESGDAVADRG